MGGGAADSSGHPYDSPITLFAQNIFTYPFNLPKDLENDEGLKFSAPQKKCLSFFAPPPLRHVQRISTHFYQNIKDYPITHKKTLKKF